MDVMLPTIEILKDKRWEIDRLVAAETREYVEVAIVSTQRLQPTNLENKKVTVQPARPWRPLYKSVGIGNQCSDHRKSMELHPGTCLRLYGLGNAWELTMRCQNSPRGEKSCHHSHEHVSAVVRVYGCRPSGFGLVQSLERTAVDREVLGSNLYSPFNFL